MSDTNKPTTAASEATPSALAPVTLEFTFGRYHGQVHPDNPSLRHGEGSLFYNSGNVYKGQWKNGAPDGVGEKQYSNGDSFVGLWSQGKRQGRGSYLYNEGHIFEGIYVDDKPNGYGILTTIQGDRYSGWWRNGLKEGTGVEILHEGQMLVGTWKNGLKEGPGKLLLPGAKKPVFGMWVKDHFTREMTPEERVSWKASRQRSDEEDRDKVGPTFLTGEDKEDWDSEFERNSSDDEREQGMISEGSAAAAAAATTTTTTAGATTTTAGGALTRSSAPGGMPSQDFARLFSSASGNPDAMGGMDFAEMSAMETRLDALERALENAMQGLTP